MLEVCVKTVNDIRLVVQFAIYQLKICTCGARFVVMEAMNFVSDHGLNQTMSVLSVVVISVHHGVPK